MKWNKAIKAIEQAMSEDKRVSVEYHIKWMNKYSKLEAVTEIVSYEWKGAECKAINTGSDQLNEGTHIIDNIYIDL